MIKTKFSRFAAMLTAFIMALSFNVIANGADTITFIVTGDSIHSEGNHSSYEEWINTSYELNGENVGEIMQNVLAQYGYSCDYSVGQWGGYLSSVTTPDGNTLGAYTNGSKSGWMSSVNDIMPDVSMDQVYPSAGDVVEIFYIDDYEAEIYGYYSTITVTPDTASLTVYSSDGAVIEPSWGAYSLFNGKYSYNASAEGYITKTGDFVVSGAGVTLDIVLDKENTSDDTTTESTTEEAVDKGVEWGLFRKNTSNNGIVNADTPNNENASVKWATKLKDDWSAFSGIAIANDAVYTVTGSTVYKLDKNSGEIIEKADLDSSIGYTYFISYGEGKVFVQLGKGEIEALDSNLNKLWTSTVPMGDSDGQGLSPVYCNNGKVYSGTVNTYDGKGYYYCLNAENGEYIWTVEGEQGSYNGFYWSGCVAVGDYIAVGGEGGSLYLIDAEGNICDTFKANSDIRSTVVYDNGLLYFTDKLGYIYSVEVDNGKFGASKSAIINENATASTSTPAIYDGKVYVGAGGMYPKGYFSVLDTDLNQIYTVELEGSVQSSPLVAVNGSDVNVYFTCNNAEGSLMVYDGTAVNKLIDTTDYMNYCIHSPIADSEGTVYYQNDSGYVAAIGKTFEETTETTTETTTENLTEITTDNVTEASTEDITEISTESTTSSNGGSVEDEDIRVSFSLVGDSTWISESNISMDQGSGVADLIRKVFENNGVSCVGIDEGYIRSITYNGTTLGEFDKGPNSGWMYKVNGEYPEVGINSYTLSEGDNVEFVYVEDYTKIDYNTGNSDWSSDSSSSSGGGGGGSSSSKTTTTETTTEVTTEAKTEATTEDVEVELYKAEVNNFNDVNENHWAYDAVNYLYELGIVKGKTESTFAPNDNVTRAEFVAMLYRMSNAGGDYNCSFSDVSNDSWYYDAVSWAYENGVVFGVSEDCFAPNDKITRQDMACIAERYADKFNVELNEDTQYTAFADENAISAYAVDSVVRLCKSNILNGNDKGEFMPLANTTRAEAAVVIYNIIG